MNVTPRSPTRLDALGRLMASIHTQSEAGQYVPCIDRRRGHLWLSEDPEDREAAALGCSTCPALDACRTYVTAHPEPAGVWAGTFHHYKRIPTERTTA